MSVDTVVLELSPKEATWLRGLLQNPIDVEHLDLEDDWNRSNREAIFRALPSERELL